jgi:hypothetical protein
MRFFEPLILAMRLPKRGWQAELLVKSLLGGRKNLL